MLNRLKVIRAENNLTQQQLADMCGLSCATINQIEKQKITPTAKTMLLISKKLNMPIEQIFLDFMLCKNNNDAER